MTDRIVVLPAGGLVLAGVDACNLAARLAQAAIDGQRRNGREPVRLLIELAEAARRAEVLAQGRELPSLMSANGQTDVRAELLRQRGDVDEITAAEAAEHLGCSERQARRIAPMLGGRKVAGRWWIDVDSLEEHLAGRSA